MPLRVYCPKFFIV